MTEQAGGAIEGTGRALKRRGILAAAGTAVAAVMAKQTAQSVAAAGSLVLETTNTVIAGTTTIKVGAGFVNTVFEVDATASTANVLYIDAIRGHGQFTGAGVHGYGADASTNTGAGLGVQGTGGNGGGTNVRDGGRGVYAYGGPVASAATAFTPTAGARVRRAYAAAMASMLRPVAARRRARSTRSIDFRAPPGTSASRGSARARAALGWRGSAMSRRASAWSAPR